MNTKKHLSDKRIYFKKCPNCGIRWATRELFLNDTNLEIIGYQANFSELTAGLFYFNHSCKGTLAIEAYLLKDLYEGPIFERRKTGTASCPGYCLHREMLQPCPEICECAYVREVIQLIKTRQKES